MNKERKERMLVGILTYVVFNLDSIKICREKFGLFTRAGQEQMSFMASAT